MWHSRAGAAGGREVIPQSAEQTPEASQSPDTLVIPPWDETSTQNSACPDPVRRRDERVAVVDKESDSQGNYVHEHGGCSVDFSEHLHGFQVTLTKTVSGTARVVDNERVVLAYIKKQRKISALEIADRLHVTTRTAQRYLKDLQNRSLIKRVGPDKGGWWEVVKAPHARVSAD